MKRLLGSVVMSVALLAALPAMALAATVQANCTSAGGSFRTHGTADNWQDHVHDGILWHVWYFGRSFQVHSWGFETGVESATVNGPNLFNPGAVCIT